MKISIIIPIYNVEPYIEKCLLSVFNQTYKNIEIILVNDCGTDKSVEIANRVIIAYQASHDIKIIHHCQNQGLSAARNSGVKIATGDYIYFLDSDDSLPPNAINTLVQPIIKHPSIDVVIGEMQTTGQKMISYSLSLHGYLNKNEDIFIAYLQDKWNVMACNKLINREFFIKYSLYFMEGFLHEDIDFSLKLAISAHSMAFCNENTYSYFIRDDSITTYKSIKNYNDLLTITTQNFHRIIKHNKSIHIKQQIISNYFIETIYTFCLHLIAEPNPLIDKNIKKELIQKARLLLQQYFHETKNCSSRYYIKKLLLQLPFNVYYPILKTYIRIRKFN